MRSKVKATVMRSLNSVGLRKIMSHASDTIPNNMKPFGVVVVGVVTVVGRWRERYGQGRVGLGWVGLGWVV